MGTAVPAILPADRHRHRGPGQTQDGERNQGRRQPAHRQVLAVFRAVVQRTLVKYICHGVGVSKSVEETEGLRAKLTRLVARPILAGPGRAGIGVR